MAGSRLRTRDIQYHADDETDPARIQVGFSRIPGMSHHNLRAPMP